MVTRKELKALGFALGTGNWPQETWVYDGSLWVYFAPVSKRAEDMVVDDFRNGRDAPESIRDWGPRSRFRVSDVDAAQLKNHMAAVAQWHHRLNEAGNPDQ